MEMKISVVEDEEDIRESLKVVLEREDYSVDAYQDGTDALLGFKKSVPDLVVLDWMLPGISGIDLLKIVRNDSRFASTGVLMLTAKAQELNIVDALNLGADDYMVKPYKKEELLARVKAVLRRYRPAAEQKVDKVSRFGEVWVDPSSYQAGDGTRTFDLTPKEFKILSHFVTNAGKLFTRAQIIAQFWGGDGEVEERAVDVHIARLREKMGASGSIIETVRGLGYRLKEKK